jgi:MFS family permease
MSYPDPGPATTLAARPTRARHWVVVFAVLLAVILYVDRVAISQAAPQISGDLGLSTSQMGWVFSAFTLAYAVFEIPGGYLGDRIGPRRVLLRIVLWWSFFTAATGWAWSWGSLLVTRFLFGAGEAGCFPNLTKAFNGWLPPAERSRVQGVMWMSTRWGGAATPMVVFGCMQFMTWRTAFMLFGLLGIGWAVVFHWWYRDNPREHRSVNAAEAARLPAEEPAAGRGVVPWGKLARSRSVWCLCGQYAMLSYAWYFFITWFPTYLLKARGFDVKQSALLAGLPLLLGGFGALAAGWISPHLAVWLGSVRQARCGLGAGALVLAAVLLVASTFVANPYVAVGLIALVSFCNDLTLPGAWTACMDVGGRCVGTLGGAMNMMGNLGGFLSPIAIGYLVERTHSWAPAFYITAFAYLLGAVFWLMIDPVTPLEQQVGD